MALQLNWMFNTWNRIGDWGLALEIVLLTIGIYA